MVYDPHPAKLARLKVFMEWLKTEMPWSKSNRT
ncbi:hypothetical protein MED121_14784 [Marinomonas sp. MED121]|nr:hypothetical protein MED121_14784 [Marinomonas sp. MED121]